MTGLLTIANWFGTFAGILGVSIAVYLQLINPRRVEPGYVMAIFIAGTAVIMVFSPAWASEINAVALKFGAALLFIVSEATAGYYVYRNGEVAPVSEVVAAFFENGNGDPL